MENERKETENKLSTQPEEAVRQEEKQEDKIVYSNEVVATIAGMAINDVSGLEGVCTPSGAPVNRSKSIGKGIRVTIASGEVSVDVCVIAEYGASIQKAAAELQDNVRKAIESMTGLHVLKVDVRVQNISFAKDNAALTPDSTKKALESGKPDKNAARLNASSQTADKPDAQTNQSKKKAKNTNDAAAGFDTETGDPDTGKADSNA